MADTSNLIRATSNQPQVLKSQRVAASMATIFECLPNKSTMIATATVANTTNAAKNVYVFVVKAGDTAGDSNRVAGIRLDGFDADAELPGESGVVQELIGLMLGPGDLIAGYANAAAAVSITLTGSVSS